MATESLPLVSVVTPCYNAASFLAETIESVLAQGYPRLQYIVVDDGSTDASWSVLTNYEGKLTSLRLSQNHGGSYARNRGAETARGEFIMFLDADDLIAPSTVAALVATARQAPHTIAFCRWHRLRQVDGQWLPAPAGVPLPKAGADDLAGWLTGKWVPPCGVLWRREDYERTGGWDESLSLGDDGDLVMRALAGGMRLALADGGEAYYRAHGSSRFSVSASIFRPDQFSSQMRVLEKLTSELRTQGRLERYAQPLGVAYHRLALLGFQVQPELGAECLRRGEALAGKRAVSRTMVGRFLTRILGVERKERFTAALANVGIMTPRRRQIRTLSKQHRDATGSEH